MEKLLAVLLLASPLHAALFWEPVTFPPDVERMRTYRLATDGTLLYAGGSSGPFPLAIDTELVSADGIRWERLPPMPFGGVSLGPATVVGGRPSKLVRISDDRPPRQVVIATYDGARGWTKGAPLTLPLDDSVGSLVGIDDVFYMGTTGGDLWLHAKDDWFRVPSALPQPARTPVQPPRVVVTALGTYVVTATGLGRLVNGQITVVYPLLTGAPVLDVAGDDTDLVVYRPNGPDRMVVDRLTRSGVLVRVASVDAGDSRGFVFFDGDDTYLAGPWNEPRLLSEGRLLSPRAARADAVSGFRFTTADGVPVAFKGGFFATSQTVLFRSRRRFVKTIPAVVETGAYSTELLLGNYGATPATARLVYRPDSGSEGAAPPVEVSLQPRHELRLPSLRAALGISGPLLGSLSVEFVGLTKDRDGFAMARVFSSTPAGTYGVTLPALPAGSGLDAGVSLSPGFLPALVKDAVTRTNVAVTHGDDGSGQPIASCLGACGRAPSLALFDEGGAAVSRQTFGLSPGMRTQWNGVASLPLETARLRGPGGGAGDAQLNDDLLAYAVRNDASTNDGVYLPLVTPSRDALRQTLFLPFLGEALGAGGIRYRSTLYLAQALETPSDAELVTFRFRLPGGEVAWEERLPAGTSRAVPDVRMWLRPHDSAGVVPASADFFGTLLLSTPRETPGLAATVVVAATSDAAPGRALTSFDALATSRWARAAIVPGLTEDEHTRSNLALANPDTFLGAQITLAIRRPDGTLAATLPDVILAPGGRWQATGVLREAGIPAGYVDLSSSRPIVAYGVSVDRGTGDGSVLPMIVTR